MKRIKDSLREFWDKNNHTNNQITGVLEEEEEKKKGIDKMFRDYSQKLPQHAKGHSHLSSRSAESHKG